MKINQKSWRISLLKWLGVSVMTFNQSDFLSGRVWVVTKFLSESADSDRISVSNTTTTATNLWRGTYSKDIKQRIIVSKLFFIALYKFGNAFVKFIDYLQCSVSEVTSTFEGMMPIEFWLFYLFIYWMWLLVYCNYISVSLVRTYV